MKERIAHNILYSTALYLDMLITHLRFLMLFFSAIAVESPVHCSGLLERFDAAYPVKVSIVVFNADADHGLLARHLNPGGRYGTLLLNR